MSSFDISRLIKEDEQVKGKDVPYRFGKGFDYGQWHVHTSNDCGVSDTYIGQVIVPGWRFGLQPNPADESVEITAGKRAYGTKDMVSNTYEVKIYDELKNMVYETRQTKVSVLRINTRHLINGVYFVHFIAGKQSVVKQLIVKH